VDKDCAGELRFTLRDVERVAGEAEVTVARLDRMTRSSRATEQPDEGWHKAAGALFPTPLPVSFDAARRHDDAVRVLMTWARYVHVQRGTQVAVDERCHHDTCRLAADRLVIGPPCPDYDRHPLGDVARMLANSTEWLRYRPDADTAFTSISAACGTIQRVVDRPADRVVVGRCPCGTYLYAAAGAADARCDGCGTTYDVAASRDGLRQDLEDRLLTAGQIATMAAYLGLTKSREAARKLINVWAARGRVVAHGLVDGDPSYRFGEVLPLLLAVHGADA
jgi:hypothetical protein